MKLHIQLEQMGVKVAFLGVLLLATVMLMIVYEFLLVTSGNTLRVAVPFPFPLLHQHTRIQVDIMNEVKGNLEQEVHAASVVSESATGNVDGMLQVRSEHLEEQRVATTKLPLISLAALHENSTTYKNSSSGTSTEHTLSLNVTRSPSPLLTTVSKGENLRSTTQLPPTMRSGQAVITMKPSPQTVLLHQNTSMSNASLHHAMIQADIRVVPTTNHLVASTTGDIPQTSLQRCKQRYCVEHLLSHEKLVYFRCSRRVPQGMDMGCRCQFVDAVGRRVVALVSLPGSGNTWVRGLLEKATGVCTGSIYCDKTLRAEGFCGEGLRSGAVLVVKTHDSTLQWKGERPLDIGVRRDRPFFDAAIFLIRSPFRAAVAEWNREVSSRFARNQNGSSHVKYVDKPQFFGESKLYLHQKPIIGYSGRDSACTDGVAWLPGLSGPKFWILSFSFLMCMCQTPLELKTDHEDVVVYFFDPPSLLSSSMYAL